MLRRNVLAVLATTVLPSTLMVSRIRAEEPNANPEKAGRPRIAVLTFRVRGTDGVSASGLGERVANMLSAALLRTNRFDLYDRRDLETLVKQLKVDASGLVDPESAQQIGKQAGVRYVILGDLESVHLKRTRSRGIGSSEVTVTVSYKAVEVETGKIQSEKHLTGEASELGSPAPDTLVNKAISRTVDDFVKTADFSGGSKGLVVQVDAEKQQIIVDLGTQQGIGKEVYLHVFRPGDEIRHPVTGKLLGRKKNTVCYGRVSGAEDEISYVEPGQFERDGFLVKKDKFRKKKELLSQVKVGDLVEVYVPETKK